ncbi:MAG: hypothetical protein ACKOXB_14105 [Flavobacteriales bacterium]
MKKFILKSLKYAAFIVLGYLSIIFCYYFLIQWYNKNPYTATNKKVFVIGNSHPQCAIKDTADIANFSMGGETVFYSVVKARKTLEAQPNAIICIEFSPLSITSANLNIADNRLPKNYRKYMYFMTPEEHFFLLKNNPLKTARVFLSPDFNSAFNKTASFLTLHSASGRKKSNSLKHNAKRSSIHDEKTKHIEVYDEEVEMQNYYSLLQLIDSHPNNLFIITTMPKSKRFVAQPTQKYFNCIRTLTQKDNVCRLDYSQNDFSENDFSDPEHMNFQGQQKFTKLFAENVQKIREAKGF